jgi:hypothetical protein
MFYTEPVSSTCIREIRYDDETEILELDFTDGTTYWYPDVPIAKFYSLKYARSIGRVFNLLIRPNYLFVKILT